MTLLDIRHISRHYVARGSYGGASIPISALDDVSLSLERGQTLGLVGESGAGKSTLGHAVLGLERPDSGQIFFEGVDIARLSQRRLRRVRTRMHLIFQDPYQSLHPGMRVEAAVAEPLTVVGVDRVERHRRVAEALDEVGLNPDRYRARFPDELSGGQRQRVALARALVGRPGLIVADEPTSMLDVSLRMGILRLLANMRERHGIAVIFITHDLALARYVSDRIGVMRNGQLVELGPTEDVIARPKTDYTKNLLAASRGILLEVAG